MYLSDEALKIIFINILKDKDCHDILFDVMSGSYAIHRVTRKNGSIVHYLLDPAAQQMLDTHGSFRPTIRINNIGDIWPISGRLPLVEKLSKNAFFNKYGTIPV